MGVVVDPPRRELLALAAVAAGLACVLAWIFFGAGVLCGREIFFTHEYASSDIWHLNLPIRAFYQRELFAGRWPLWCPEMGTGMPLLAAAEVGALYPVNLLLFGTLPLSVAFNLSLVVALVGAAAGAAMFARQCGVTCSCSVFAAQTFAFGGFFLVHLKHPAMIAAAAWGPVILLGVDRFLTGGRRTTLVALAIAVGLSATAGHPQMTYYGLLVAGAHAVLRGVALRHRVGALPGRLTALAAAVGLGMALAAPQILATAELHEHGPRAGGITAEQAGWEYRLEHLLHFVDPLRRGDPGELVEENAVVVGADGAPRRVPMLRGYEDSGGPSLFWEVTGYLGVLPLLLAGLAIVVRRRRTELGIAALLVLVVLAMPGRQGPLGPVLHLVPGFELFRFHGRLLVHAALLLAVLAGAGLSWLIAVAGAARWRTVACCAAALTAGLLDVHDALGDHNPTVDAAHWMAAPPVAARVLDATVDGAPPARLGSTDRDREVFENAYNRARGWKGDLTPYDPARLMLAPNLNVLHGVPHIGLWGPLYPRWAMTIAQAVHGGHRAAAPPGGRARRWSDAIASLFNVAWVLDPFGELSTDGQRYPVVDRWPGDARLAGRWLVDAGRYDITLRRNVDVLPRAFLVGGAVAAASDGEALARITDPAFAPRRSVVLTASDARFARGPAAPPDGRVAFRSHGPQQVVLDVATKAPAWLFLADTWYPGWRARVSGHEVPVLRANVAGRAVAIPAGEHEVVFEYECAPWRRGWWWALGAALVIMVMAAPWPHRPRRTAP